MLIGWDYTVTFLDAAGAEQVKTIAAAYFTTDEELVLFKDIEHRAVFAVLRDRFICVERGDSVVKSADNGSAEPA